MQIVDPIPICGKVDMLGIGKGEEYIQVLAESTAKRRALMSEIISEETEEEKAKREAEITLKESIREQVKNMTQVFYCELCDKRYSSVPEWERHLSSYSHNHKKRFKDMRERTKHLNASGDGAGTHEKAMTREERELQRRKEAEEKELKRMLKLAEKHSSASQNKPSSGSSSTVADANSNANTDNSLGRDSNKQGVDIQTFETQGKAGWMSSGTMVSVQQKPSFGEPPGAPVVPMKSSGKESSIPAATHQTSPEGGRKPLTSTKLSFGLSSSSSSITGPKKLQPSKKFKLVFGKK
ncbi:hypothetical protein H4219_002293 [Mycoemilia scoparia]|uniref:C2H2-type domain-containing protein n=1 Tax=Mycoemilia scoparia TaxID=417184 RepID=A0A9W7ZXY5_9FUNG|nr:hypothetical protein H4219_002293 [Mycoemilia scoparia]